MHFLHSLLTVYDQLSNNELNTTVPVSHTRRFTSAAEPNSEEAALKKLLALAIISTTLLFLIAANLQAQADQPLDMGRVMSINCPINVPDSVTVECGALHVPENYAAPDNTGIRLPYIILHSKNPTPAPDPLIYTAGGPGWSSLDSAWGFANSPLLEDRDLIIFEQRGNKYSEPSLMCDKSIWWEEEPGHTPCLDSIQAKGIDLAQFNTQNIVRDIIALRHALGYEQWNLYGTSFSTSLMLLLMEADPAGVRSAILHSVKPPNETTFAHEADSALRAIQHLFASCTADPLCAAAYPDLETQFHELLKSLNASPLEVEVWSWSENAFIPIKFDGDKLIDWIMLDSFYQPAFPPFGTAYLPLFISELNRGNLAPLKAAAQGYWNGMIENSHWSWGLFLAINCQQALPAAGSSRPAADIAASEMLDGFARSTAQRTICVEWDLPALPPAATAYVQSDIPALILAGSYDPVTPPAWSRATADHLANSTYVEFPGYGHNVTINNPCAATLQAEFLRNPQDKLDINCVTEAPGPSFIMRKDLFIAPGIAVSANDIELGGPRGTAWIETTAVISLLALATLLLILLIIGLVWLLRRRKRAARLDKSAVAAYLLALLVIISALTIPILTTRINNEYLGRNTILYSLGPNRDFGPAILMAWIAPLASLLILILALITLWAWLVRRWPLTFRILITLVILASLIFLFLALRWGLFTMLL